MRLREEPFDVGFDFFAGMNRVTDYVFQGSKFKHRRVGACRSYLYQLYPWKEHTRELTSAVEGKGW